MLIWLTLGCTVALGQAHEAPAAIRPASKVGDPIAECRCTCRRSGVWTIAETANFSVWCQLPSSAAEQLARKCETLRSDMRAGWLGGSIKAEWTPRCVVVLHRNSTEFARHVGTSLRAPVGCTTVTRDGGRVIFRRLDLRQDAADWRSNALAHELSHIALADAVPTGHLPVWLDEGFAMTFETPELQQHRLQVLKSRLNSGRLPSMREILAARDLPQSNDADVLYAASLSLVTYLQRVGGAESLLPFARESAQNGCERALLEVYNITGGHQELERRWLAALRSQDGGAGSSALEIKNASQPFHSKRPGGSEINHSSEAVTRFPENARRSNLALSSR